MRSLSAVNVTLQYILLAPFSFQWFRLWPTSVTTKLTFLQQNVLQSHFITTNRSGRLIKMAAEEEDTVDGCTKTLRLMQHGTVVVMTKLNHIYGISNCFNFSRQYCHVFKLHSTYCSDLNFGLNKLFGSCAAIFDNVVQYL